MREILFRGKMVDGLGWIEGSLIKWKHFNGKNYEDTYSIKDLYCNEFLVHPESVGQFTGLHDKNGKRIFEGDLLMSNGKMFYVKYRDLYTEFFMETLDNTYSLSLGGDGPSIEIIGNIHDNPELI